MIAAERLAGSAESAFRRWQARVHEMMGPVSERVRHAMATDTVLIVELINENEPGLASAMAEALSDRYGLPTIILTMHQGKYHGFCQGIPGCDLYAALLERCPREDILRLQSLKFQIAIEPALLSEFQERIHPAVRERVSQEALHTRIRVDAELPGEHLTLGLYGRLQLLEPYGFKHRRPVFLTRGLRVIEETRAEDEDGLVHFRVDTGSGSVRAVVGHGRDLAGELPEYIDIVHQLHTRYKQGVPHLEMRVLDLRESGWVDKT